jgi:hypothetical protein
MACYWIVVPRGNGELFDLLSMAFEGRPDFSVIVERRDADGEVTGRERRGRGPDVGPDEILVAERAQQADPTDRHTRVPQPTRGPQRVPVRRIRRRHAAERPVSGGAGVHTPLTTADSYRLFNV